MRRILFFALISLMLPSGKSEDEDKNENSDSKDGQNKDEGSDKNLSTLQDKLKKMRDDDKDNFNNLPGYIKKLISPSIKDQKNKKDEQGNKEGESSKDTSESRSGRTGGEGASNPPKDNKNDDGNRSPQSLLIREVSSNIPQPIKNVDVRFSDVIGIDEFRHEFEEIVDFLKSPEKYKNAGARIPKGVLLVGAPGCGKTLMAKALAGESSCSFFYKSASEFEEVYVGVGASRMRGLFTAAKKHAPSIIFIDELDSLAGKREAFSRSNNRQCINQMLAEMDGFRKNDSVIVIGATNLEQSLDPAIKRSGRFDKVVRIPHPDRKGRESILSYYGQKIKMKGVDLHLQAKRTIGFTGADLKNFLNIAILRAVKLDREYAINDDFDFAYDRIKMGIRRAGLLADLEEKRATAIHEVGHALVCEKTAGAMPLYKVTILPSGHSLGHTAMVPDKDLMTQTRKNIEASIDVALGGRAAEEVFLGDENVTTGCSSDLQNATNLAYSYVRDLGMMEDEIFLNEKSEKMSEEYKYKVDKMVQKMLKESLERTKKLIIKHRSEIERLVDALTERETLTAEEFREILD